MTHDLSAVLFRRDLPDHITVVIDGLYGDLNPDEAAKDSRAIGRVVLAMPDFYAEALAHALATLLRVADVVNADTWVGHTERALAEALFAAAMFMGCHCHDGGLRLPDEPPGRPD